MYSNSSNGSIGAGEDIGCIRYVMRTLYEEGYRMSGLTGTYSLKNWPVTFTNLFNTTLRWWVNCVPRWLSSSNATNMGCFDNNELIILSWDCWYGAMRVENFSWRTWCHSKRLYERKLLLYRGYTTNLKLQMPTQCNIVGSAHVVGIENYIKWGSHNNLCQLSLDYASVILWLLCPGWTSLHRSDTEMYLCIPKSK